MTALVGNKHCDQAADTCMLPQLRAVSVVPNRCTQRANVARTLRQIHSLSIPVVTQRNRRTQYIIQLQRKSTSISGRRSGAFQLMGLTTVHDVPRRFSEFVQLRDQLYGVATKGHSLGSCKYCSAWLNFLLVGPCQPQLFTKLLHSTSGVQRRLERFLYEVVKLTVQSSATVPHGSCDAQERIPSIVAAFLCLDEQATP
ncbi:hypothetical protein PINS_up022371 [Pythium insidiosum]|nr:hypothetical protein PINS_up006386 [Pythium insidiosum]GLE10270.1 hypothetical protein PINS_up022371 [Pythium insidiosum]